MEKVKIFYNSPLSKTCQDLSDLERLINEWLNEHIGIKITRVIQGGSNGHYSIISIFYTDEDFEPLEDEELE